MGWPNEKKLKANAKDMEMKWLRRGDPRTERNATQMKRNWKKRHNTRNHHKA